MRSTVHCAPLTEHIAHERGAQHRAHRASQPSGAPVCAPQGPAPRIAPSTGCTLHMVHSSSLSTLHGPRGSGPCTRCVAPSSGCSGACTAPCTVCTAPHRAHCLRPWSPGPCAPCIRTLPVCTLGPRTVHLTEHGVLQCTHSTVRRAQLLSEHVAHTPLARNGAHCAPQLSQYSGVCTPWAQDPANRPPACIHPNQI